MQAKSFPLSAPLFFYLPLCREGRAGPHALSPHRCSLCGGQAGAGREPPWRLRAFAWRKTAERARKRPLGSPPLLLVSLGRGAVIKSSLREPSPTIGPLGGNPRVLIQLGCSASGCKLSLTWFFSFDSSSYFSFHFLLFSSLPFVSFLLSFFFFFPSSFSLISLLNSLYPLSPIPHSLLFPC